MTDWPASPRTAWSEAGGTHRRQDQVPGPYRILKLAPTPFFSDYGCHVRILEEARALRRLGTTAVVCTYPTGNDPAGITTVRTMGLPREGEIRVGASAHKFYLDALLLGTGLRTGLSFRPDIVHGHLHEGALLGTAISRALRRPLVFDFQGSLTSEMIDHGFLKRSSLAYQPFRWIERVVNRVADVILTSSRAAADLLVREFGCSAARIVPIPDGVDTEVFRPIWTYSAEERQQIRAELGLPPGRKVVVYLGLLAEYQGSGLLLHAAAEVLRQHPDVHFLLMGYPGERRYRHLARELGIDAGCTFTGRVAYERAPRYLVAGDVAVAPKLSSTEANGKLLNYMALGLPTVAFESSVNRDVLGEAGVFAPMGDAAQLARALLHVLTHDDEAEARARALRRRAEERFTWIEAARQILDVYAALLDK